MRIIIEEQTLKIEWKSVRRDMVQISKNEKENAGMGTHFSNRWSDCMVAICLLV